MANTRMRAFRVDDDLFEAFSAVVARAGLDRSAVTRDLWRWYAQHPPGSPLPTRPDGHEPPTAL